MTASLTIPRKVLTDALKTLRKFAAKKTSGEAILSYESGMLTIQVTGAIARAKADGSWDGEARIPGKQLAALSRSISPGDPVEISVDGDWMAIGKVSIPCVWQEKAGSRIHLPLNAPLQVILAVALKHTPEEIRASGLANVVEKAEQKRDELIGRAANALAPMGVSFDELSRFVDEHVGRVALPDYRDSAVSGRPDS